MPDEVVVSTWDDAFVRRWLQPEATTSSRYEPPTVTWDSSSATTAYYTFTWNTHQEIRYVADAIQRRHSEEEMRRREAERQAERAAQLARQAEARQRAWALLDSLLTDDQRETLEEHEYIQVVVGSLGGRYRIGQGTNGNVLLLDDDNDMIARLCAHPRLEMYDDQGQYVGELPWADVAAGQLLALTTDERAWLEVANVQWINGAGSAYLESRGRRLRTGVDF